jgi:hypothetical protein
MPRPTTLQPGYEVVHPRLRHCALDDEEWGRRRTEYAHRLNSIGASLGDWAEELVATVNLHDAQVQDWGFEAGRCISASCLGG